MLLEKRAKVIELALAWSAAARVEPPVVKRRIGIEELLRWAYREELPKEGAPSANVLPQGFAPRGMKTGKFLEKLAVIDNASVNRYGLLPDEAALRGPHADAVIVGECVKAPDEFELGLPGDWDPSSDFGEMDGMRDDTSPMCSRGLP